MVNKKLMIMAIFLISLLAVSAVSAADNVTNDIVNVEITNDGNLDETESNILSSGDEYQLMAGDNIYGQLANKLINAESGSIISLTQNYTYQDISSDTPYVNGIPIDKPLTIEGNGIIIDANNKAGFFNITSDNVIINNITFKNAKNTGINWKGSNGVLNNTMFSSNNARLINWEGNNNAILNSKFVDNLINNTDDSYSGIQYSEKDNYGLIYQKGDNNLVYNSDFSDNYVFYRGWSSLSEISFNGGVLYIDGDNTIIKSNNFNKNSLEMNMVRSCYYEVQGFGGVLYLKGEDCKIDNSKFVENNLISYFQFTYQNYATSFSKGGAVYVDGTVDILNSYFNLNHLWENDRAYGGAVYINSENGYDSIIDSEFVENGISCSYDSQYGSAVHVSSFDGDIINSTFDNNYGVGAVDLYGYWNVMQSTFTNNINGAIRSNSKGNINYNIFLDNTRDDLSRKIYYISATNGVNVDYNWWGDNTNPQAFIEGTICNNWLCSNIIIEDLDEKNRIIYTKLNLLSDGTIVSDEDYNKLPMRSVKYTLFGKGSLTPKNSDTYNPITYLNDKTETYEVKITSTVDNQKTEIIMHNQTVELKLSTIKNNPSRFVDGVYGQLANKLINAESGSIISLTQNYTYQDISSDTPYVNGIPIDKPLTIEGNGIIIDANNKAGFFNITSDNVIINNITFKNAKNTGINWKGSNGVLNNTMFSSNNARLINWEGNNNAILNSKFVDNLINNTDDSYSGIQYSEKDNYGLIYQKGDNNLVYNSDFSDNYVFYRGWSSLSEISFNGGVLYIDGDNTIIKSNNFNKNSLEMNMVRSCYYEVQGFGGVLYLKGEDCKIDNSKFVENNLISYFQFTYQNYATSFSKGGAVYVDGTVDILNSYFNLNHLWENDRAYGGAVYINSENGYDSIIDSEFVENGISCSYDSQYGSAVHVSSFDGDIINSTFDNNYGVGAVDLYGYWNVMQSTFTNNINGAIRSNSKGNINYNIFLDNTRDDLSRKIYYISATNGVNVDYNWWGDNTNPQAFIEGTICNNWLCSNFVIGDSDKDNIYTKLNLLSNGSLLNDDDYNKLPIRNVTYSLFGKGSLSSSNSDTASNIKYINGKPGEYEITITSKVDNQTTQLTKEIIVDKWDTEITANNYTINYSDELVVEVFIANSTATGNISLIVNNIEYVENIIDNKATFELPTLDAGIYEYDAIYNGDSNYNYIEANGLIIVNKTKDFNMDVSFLPNEIVYGDQIVMTVTFDKNLTGTVSFDINSEKYIENIIGNKSTFILNNLNVGIYSIMIIYSGDINHESKNNTVSFIVAKAETNISAPDISINYGDANGKLIATLTNAKGIPLSANMVVSLNGVDYYLKSNSKGQVAVSTKDLAIGKYIATITYSGNSKYKPSNTTATVIINKLATILSVADVSVQYGDISGKLIATLTNAEGVPLSANMVILLNGVEYALKSNSKGQISVSTADLAPGEYTTTITYKGNSKYAPSTTTAKVTVINKLDSVVSAEDVTVKYGDANGKFVATLTNAEGIPLSANIVINLNGVDYAMKTNSKGRGSISTASLAPGEYTATITYKGNSKYNPSSATAKVTVTNKLDSFVSAEDVTVRYGDVNGKLIATLTNAEGVPLSANIVINLNGVDYAMKTNSKGQGSVSTKELAPGTYTATITYKGNSKYAPSSTTAKVTVTDKLVSVVSAEDVTVRCGDANGKLIATLTNAEGIPLSANIVISLNGVDYAMKTNSKGQASVSTKDLAVGEYTATITYKGNSKYAPSTTTAKVIVNNKLVSVVTASDVTVKQGDANGKLIATLTNAEGTPLSANMVVSLNGVNYALKSNSKGNVAVSTADLAPGEYTATITYKGNSKYNPSSTTAKVTVIDRLETCISGIYNAQTKEVIGTLTNGDGVPLSANVVVSLNGVNYALKSDSKGLFKVSAAGLSSGKYVAKLVYKGNSKYAPSSATVNVVIP